MTETVSPLCLSVPSKSFFVGEYLALTGGPTLLAATLPRFGLRVRNGRGAMRGIASASPAGRLIAAHLRAFASIDVEFFDPHAGAGGWGASSAQFLMCYAALERTIAGAEAKVPDVERLLATYFDVAWDGRGARPSGADVVAQLEGGLVEYCRGDGIRRARTWPFRDLEFFFLATGHKIATHEHLKTLGKLDVTVLRVHAQHACDAMATGDSAQFVEAMRGCAGELERQSLVEAQTLALLRRLDALSGVLASKGCGALGADVVVAIVSAAEAPAFVSTVERSIGIPVGRAQLSHGLAIDA